MAVAKRQLGQTELEITPVGLGCWQFCGRGGLGGLFWKSPPQDEVDRIVKTALEGDVNWFDTAESYGSGRSEEALSTALSNADKVDGEVVIATKWWPIFRTARNLSRTIGDRQRHLAPFHIDLHQIHLPISFSSVEAEMNAMAALVKAGNIRCIGVSNFSAGRMRRAHAALEKHGLTLASNQVEFHLLNRSSEKNGVLDAARELNITIIAESPLAQGVLTGKFHKDPESVKKLPFLRKMLVGRMIEKSRPLIKTLEDIAGSYNRSASEVALSWTVNYHGDSIVAIPGASKTEHALQNVGAMTLKLSRDEMARIDEVSRMVIS